MSYRALSLSVKYFGLVLPLLLSECYGQKPARRETPAMQTPEAPTAPFARRPARLQDISPKPPDAAKVTIASGIKRAWQIPWEPIGLSGGGGMFSPAISPADRNLMILNCDMSGAYISEDGGRNWRMINHAQLRSDTRCRPGFHPSDPDIIYASSGGRLRISRDRGRTFAPVGDLKQPLYGEIAINPSDPDVMLVGTLGGGCWLSRDAGATWTTTGRAT